ncbi:MAG: glycosyltransferase [Saprospirales bacterium]|nr:glycosyltransferase [Saprospirales bacterium]MBK8490810.1 glycosyltransferase [Saprospirales bacterium]
MADLSVVIPIYNEEGNIPVLYERLTAVLEGMHITYQLIFINDGSRDRSMELLHGLATKDARVKYIDFSRNFGHQVALSAGLDRTQGEAVVMMDADLQDPPELLVELYQKYKEGYEVVYARRRSRQGETYFKKSATLVFYRLLARMSSIEIPLDTGDFRIIDHKVVEMLRRMPEKIKYLRGQISWIGFRQTSIEYDRPERYAGETGYSFRKLMGLALDGITGFSDVPLKIVTYFGLIVTGFAFIMTIYVLYSWFSQSDLVQGWSSLMITVLFIGGVQMIAIGIIGEYLSRIHSNVRNRPLYVIRDSNF